MTLTPTDWHGYPAWALENDAVRSVIVPQFGAKIASLFDKRSGHEWMLPATLRPVRPIPYGATFIEYDMSGWDEMFPTIDRCEYPVPGAHQGAVLPDHGEVWALDWQVESSSDALVLSIEGQCLPYTLRRTANLTADALRLDYEVQNKADEPLFYLWSAHPLFNADTQTRLILPDNITEMVNIIGGHPVLGDFGTRHAFPETASGLHLDQVAPPADHTFRKVFAPPEVVFNWAQLQQADTGAYMRMDWDAERLPYMGVWVDEGCYTVTACIAPEPMSGYHDSLTKAYANNRVSVLPIGGSHTWTITLTLGQS